MTTPLDLRSLACQNPGCAEYRKVGRGNLITGSRYGDDQTKVRYTCVVCGKSFAATRGSMFYRLHTDPERILRILAQLPARGSIRATAQATGVSRDTISNWIRRALAHNEEARQQFVEVLDLLPAEVDALSPFLAGE